MTVNNISALSTANKISAVNNQMRNSSANLASGNRLNSAAQGAAELAIAMKMQSQIGGTSQVIRNAADGINMIQTAEGALIQTNAMLARINELSVQAANGIWNDSQRGFMQAEINQLQSEINRISSSTNFNGTKLLDGSLAGSKGMTLQIGANNAAEQRFMVSINSMSSNALGLFNINVGSADSARNSIGNTGNAIGMVSGQRASLGAMQNRLEHTINSLNNSVENQVASMSRIADTDMASEIINHTKNNILRQTSLAMLAHQIKEPQGILSLLNPGNAGFAGRI